MHPDYGETFIGMPTDRYEIDRNKVFEHLAHAPIVEAVIEIKCPPQVSWDEDTIPDEVAKLLQGYQLLDSRSEYSQNVNIKDNVHVPEAMEKVGWKGVRYRSEDETYVAAFNRDGFVFSRVGNYETWAKFSAEAMRIWEVHRSIASPSDVHRIGLRFINRIPLPSGEVKLDDFMYDGPKPPKDLDFRISGFLHKNILSVPGHPYLINIVRTSSPSPSAGGDVDYAIILDIDVYLQETFEVDDSRIQGHLEDMRILKNEVFWGSIPPALLESLRGDN